MAKSSVPCKHAWTTKSGEEWIGLEVCRGCGRTVDEVAQWVFMDKDQREVVWQRILAEGYPRRNY